jgi:hypothetical protein
MFSLSFLRKHRLVLLISVFLFIVPFFWLRPGEMDLGGDGSRLYFYDQVNYLKNTALYDISVAGMGTVLSQYYIIPYIGLIALLKFFITSPTFAIGFINGLKLAGAFIGIYLIVCEFLKETYPEDSRRIIDTAAILAGVFYIVSFGSTHMSSEWDTALLTHNQIFLNPLIFYFLFKFFLAQRYIYLWIALLISFVFAPNYSYDAAPSFLSFYPLAFIFLCTYIKFFSKKPIPWKGIYIGFLLFLGIQAFHLLSQAYDLFDSSSELNTMVFRESTARQEGINYFTAVSPNGMAILNLLLPSGKIILRWMSFASPAIVIIGFILNKKKAFLLIALFFLLTFFLATANITQIGFELYKSLFYIPAFSMFRIFFAKWMYVFLFFYSLLFGFAVCNIILKLKLFYSKLFSILVFALLIAIGIPLFFGELVNNNVVRGSNNVKSVIKMDPRFEETLQFIRSLPDDGKFLSMPLTDFSSQVLYGKDGGAYAGIPILSRLTQRYGFYGDRDFGWQVNDPVRYTEEIKKYAREKNYDWLLSIFTSLNIRYIFHNSDPNAYEAKFSNGGPWYYYIKDSLPNTQQGYTDFIHHFPVRQIYKNGPYVIYEIDESNYNPTIFIPQGIYESGQLSFDRDKAHAVFIDTNTCNKVELKKLCNDEYKPPLANINFRMINPTLYEVTVRQKEPVDNMLLVMQHTFNKGWKLVIDKKNVPENQHIAVNGYANGWLLTKKDLPDEQSYTLFIKLDQQKYFWYGWTITSGSLAIVIFLLIYSLFSRKKGNKL